ncbi:MAG: helix-turn-helix domain-containing protein [Pseudomonadota bacterium]
MSNRAMSWAVEVRGLAAQPKLVLMLLADCHNGSTGQCNPSFEWLRERTGFGERALQMHMAVLETAGLIDRLYKNGGRGKGRQLNGFHLKLGILTPAKSCTRKILQVQNPAPAKSCTRKITSEHPQNLAGSYKEEPEKNRNLYVANLDTLWAKIEVQGRRRTTRKKFHDAYRKAAKIVDEPKLFKATLTYLTLTPAQYQKGLDRWLNAGLYEGFLPQQHKPKRQTSNRDALFRTFSETGEWRGQTGDERLKPTHPESPLKAEWAAFRKSLEDDLAASEKAG